MRSGLSNAFCERTGNRETDAVVDTVRKKPGGGQNCPGLGRRAQYLFVVLKTKKALEALLKDQVLKVETTDPESRQGITAWEKRTGKETLRAEEAAGRSVHRNIPVSGVFYAVSPWPGQPLCCPDFP
jgi:TusA-related sulfurtransferase